MFFRRKHPCKFCILLAICKGQMGLIKDKIRALCRLANRCPDLHRYLYQNDKRHVYSYKAVIKTLKILNQNPPLKQ